MIKHAEQSHLRSLNAYISEKQGSSIHIGVVDTLGEPPKSFRSEYEVREVFDDYITSEDDEFVLTDQDDPIGHGRSVIRLASAVAPKSSFSTFQAVGAVEIDGEIEPAGRRSDAVQAVADAADIGVDVLNLSIGVTHECNGTCSLGREARLAIEEDDVCIVSATGNDEPSEGRIGVDCPSMVDSVISVAGYLSFCRPGELNQESSRWWLENGDDIVGPFCGQGGLCGKSGCSKNSHEKLWEGNVSFHNAAPDVLGPVIEMSGKSLDHVEMQIGTSFAAPRITGLLGSVVSDLNSAGVEPDARSLRKAAVAASKEIDEGGYNKVDVQKTYELLKPN